MERVALILLSTVVSLALLFAFGCGERSEAADDFYADLTVGEPEVHGNLAVYPIYLPGGGEKLDDLLTMSEAMDSDRFKITELEEGATVNSLEVRNNTGKSVVLLAGEIIRGAKQDRIVSYDTVVPPEGTFYVDAFCVEAGRWTEVSDSFAYNDEIAPSTIRGSAQGYGDQGKVWDEVAKCNAERGVFTESDALTASYSDEDFQEKVSEYKDAFEDIADDKDVVGIIVVSEGEIQAGDIFAGHDLFAKVWPRLLTSYAMDAALSEELGDVPEVSEIEDYLAQLNDADRETTFEDDNMNRAEMAKGDMEAYELEYKNKKMHLNVYKTK
ncbi:MAG: hypothetical protein GY771_08025 [bacterium]|nr:hypothetical protein [bacterium]